MNNRGQVHAALARWRSQARWLPGAASVIHRNTARGDVAPTVAPRPAGASVGLLSVPHHRLPKALKGLWRALGPLGTPPPYARTCSPAGVRHDPVAPDEEGKVSASATRGTHTSRPRVSDRCAVAILWRCSSQPTPKTPNVCRTDGLGHHERRWEWLGCVAGSIGLISQRALPCPDFCVLDVPWC
jgi:hypothetical protein